MVCYAVSALVRVCWYDNDRTTVRMVMVNHLPQNTRVPITSLSVVCASEGCTHKEFNKYTPVYVLKWPGT